jgi:predicted regulator of Ras-like GTPase activity (Roadblock/LC7/MglB family)
MSVRQILDAWDNRAAVRGAAVVSEDGLVVHDLLDPAADSEAVAALAVTVIEHGRQFGDAQGPTDLRTVVLDLANGPAILTPLDDRHALVVLAQPDRDIGPLLFEIRQSRSALTRAI